MSITPLDPATLKHWLDARQAVLVDVREPAEYASEHIAGATLVPLGSIGKETLPELGGRRLVIHCRKGGRGQSACEKLHKHMPDIEFYNLVGGIEAWMAAGLPVERSHRRVLPLDRQVQLSIGLCLLIGSSLGFFYDRSLFLLTGLIGAGLTMAGLTGFCGLARGLALMPWNR